jgi:hypothetical protein
MPSSVGSLPPRSSIATHDMSDVSDVSSPTSVGTARIANCVFKAMHAPMVPLSRVHACSGVVTRRPPFGAA